MQRVYAISGAEIDDFVQKKVLTKSLIYRTNTEDNFL